MSTSAQNGPANEARTDPSCLGCIFVPFIPMYFGAVALFFVYVVPFLAALGCLVFIAIILHRHRRTLGATIRKTRRLREGDEPAIKQYFYGTGWEELRLSLASTNEAAVALCGRMSGFGRSLFAEPLGCVTYPLGAATYVVLAASALAAYIVLGVAVALHAVILAACLAVLAIAVGVLRAAELASMAVRRIYLVCPNRDCHQRIALPVYGCPKCGARHRTLLPGSYGATRRRCKCGNTLPTLFLLGRGRIPAFCPHASCGKPLSEAIGSARNVHIAVVGGPFAGKTAFLTAAMIEIQRQGTIEMQFPERADRLAFEAAAERFAKGITVDKTAGASPNAMLLRVADARGDQSLLYIYDAAGELYSGMSELRRQNYFSHGDGVALLVDPFSLESMRIDRSREIAALEPQLRASTALPQDVYGRLAMVLREQQGGNRIDVPLAIVVTKVDAVGIEPEIEALGVREWLVRHGEANLVQSAEHDFRTVRYFACSALGRMPSATTSEAFVSRAVLEPFHWLAESNGVRLR